VRKGLTVCLELVGPPDNDTSMEQLRRAVKDLGAEAYVRYRGPIPHAELPTVYAEGDAFVFASSCENLPNCLLEAMSAGLPIACSNRLPMPRILGKGGVYFDPNDSDDIARSLEHLITSPQARRQFAAISYENAQHYSWKRCADDTFSFLRAAVA